MANVQSIIWDPTYSNLSSGYGSYRVILDSVTTEEQIFTTSNPTGLKKIGGFTRAGVTIVNDGEGVLVPAGEDQFSTYGLAGNSTYLELDGVVADDIGTSADISNISFENFEFTITLQQALTNTVGQQISKTFEFSFENNPIGASILETSNNVSIKTLSIPWSKATPEVNGIILDKVLVVPAGVTSFKISIGFPVLSVDRDISISLDTTVSNQIIPAFTETNLPGVTDPTNTDAIPYDYTAQINSIASSLDLLAQNSIQIYNILKNLKDNVNIQTESINRQVAVIEELMSTSGGIPIKDVYADLSYSSLINYFEQEGIDVDTVIQKTKSKLDDIEGS